MGPAPIASANSRASLSYLKAASTRYCPRFSSKSRLTEYRPAGRWALIKSKKASSRHRFTLRVHPTTRCGSGCRSRRSDHARRRCGLAISLFLLAGRCAELSTGARPSRKFPNDETNLGLRTWLWPRGRRRPNAAPPMLDHADMAVEAGEPLPALGRQTKRVDRLAQERFDLRPEEHRVVVRHIGGRLVA